MGFNLKNRSFETLLEFSTEEIHFLLRLSEHLKIAKYAGTEQQKLKGKNIALIFEKTSTRTRCAFEVAAHDQGAHVTYLGPSGTQIGVKESMKDTARVLGRFYDGIEYRGFKQESVHTLAEYSGVPVWNGLTDNYHPTQILADLMTMKEHKHTDLNNISFCYLGDASHNMGDSLMIGAAKMGMDFRIASPKSLWPNSDLIKECQRVAEETGAKILLTDDTEAAVKGCDFLYTDVWVSMGEPDDVWAERIKLLTPYQVNKKMMEMTGNNSCKFMHCLPAFHNRETQIGEKIYQKYGLDALEVTDDVFESKQSIVFDQAENRLHTIKSLLVAMLGE